MRSEILFLLSSFRSFWTSNTNLKTSTSRSTCSQPWRTSVLTLYLQSKIKLIKNKESFAGSFSVTTSWSTKISERGFSRSITILSWDTRTMSSIPCSRVCWATCWKLRWALFWQRIKRKSGKTNLLEARSLRWYIQIIRTSICVVRIIKTTYTLYKILINYNHEKKKKRSWPVEFTNSISNKRRSLKRRKM